MKNYYSLSKDGKRQVSLPGGKTAKCFCISEFRNIDSAIDEVVIDDQQASLLEQARVKFGLPIYIAIANRNSPYESYHNPKFGDSCATDFDVGDSGLGTIDYLTVCQYLESIGARGLGLYDYIDINGKHIRFIHMDMRGAAKSFWKCSGINPDGTQKLDHVDSFFPPAPKKETCPYAEPAGVILNRINFTGTPARWYQWHLVKLGYDCGVNPKSKNYANGTDGSAQTKTWDAIESFTKSVGLGIGAAGQKTRNALKAAYAQK